MTFAALPPHSAERLRLSATLQYPLRLRLIGGVASYYLVRYDKAGALPHCAAAKPQHDLRSLNQFALRLEVYNGRFAEIDQDQNDLQAAEAELNELNRRFLSAGEATYGPDSNEYEMLGGTRKSERKKPTKKSGGSSGSGGSGSGPST